MYYSNSDEDILGIIALTDENGDGGNIYIDPDVTNVVGTIFAEKSVMSFDADGVGVIDLGELKKHPEIEEVFEDDYTTDDDFALRGRQGYGKIPHVIETREDQGSAQELPAFDDYDPDQMD